MKDSTRKALGKWMGPLIGVVKEITPSILNYHGERGKKKKGDPYLSSPKPKQYKVKNKKLSVRYWESLNVEPSFMESVMIQHFDKNEIPFLREVCFEGLIAPVSGRYFRFDFFLPKYNIIVEYDGGHHFTPEFAKKDAIKNAFAKRNNIQIWRFNKYNFKDFKGRIKKLVKG